MTFLFSAEEMRWYRKIYAQHGNRVLQFCPGLNWLKISEGMPSNKPDQQIEWWSRKQTRRLYNWQDIIKTVPQPASEEETRLEFASGSFSKNLTLFQVASVCGASETKSIFFFHFADDRSRTKLISYLSFQMRSMVVLLMSDINES